MNPEYNLTNNHSAFNASFICATAEYLADNVYMNLLLIFRVLLSVFGIVFNLILIKIQGNHLAVHRNAAILLNNHHLSVILQCGFGVVHAYNLITYHTFDNPCDLIMTYRACIFFRFIPTTALYATVFSLVLMTAERFWASYTYKTYEKSSFALGVWLVIIEWITAIGVVIWYIYDGPFEQSFSYCTLVDNTNLNNRIIICQIPMNIIEILAIFCYYGLLKWNKRRKSRLITASLTEKYQVDENIRAIQLMTPMLITHVVCYIPPLVIFVVYFMVDKNFDPANYPIFEESFNWGPIYCAVLPVILLWYHRALRASLWRMFHPSSVIHFAERDGDAAAVAEHHFHFETLNLAWGSAPKAQSVASAQNSKVELTMKQDSSKL